MPELSKYLIAHGLAQLDNPADSFYLPVIHVLAWSTTRRRCVGVFEIYTKASDSKRDRKRELATATIETGSGRLQSCCAVLFIEV